MALADVNPDISLINVAVAVVLPDWQYYQCIKIAPGTTAAEVLEYLNLPEELAQRGISQPLPMGIFGRRITPEVVLKEGNRLELYLPLQRDPKTVRRARAERHAVGRRRPLVKRT